MEKKSEVGEKQRSWGFWHVDASSFDAIYTLSIIYVV